MTSFHYLINNSGTTDFFDWDEVAKQYPSHQALTQAVVRDVSLCSGTDVEFAFENLQSRVSELFDTLEANPDFQTDLEMQNKLGVSLLRLLLVLSGMNSGAPNLDLNNRYPMNPDINNFVNEFLQRKAIETGYVQTINNDLAAEVDPYARMKDRTVFNFDKSGHLKTEQLFRDSWKEFEETLDELDLEVDEEVVERMIDLIAQEPSPAAEWVFDWLGLVSSYPEPEDLEEMSPRFLQMLNIARIRPDLEAALEESEDADIQRACEELAFQFNGWTSQFQKSPELDQDTKTRAVYGAMTALVMAFALTNDDCRELIIKKTHLRKVGFL